MTEADVAEVPWRRQSPLLFLIQGWDVARAAVFQIAIPLYVAADSDMSGGFRLLLVGFAIAPLLPLLWVWFVHRYRLLDDAVEVRSGLLVRRRVLLPLDRVQAANRTAGLLQRVFGLVRLELKSGAAGTQVDLKALAPAEAERLLAAVARARDGAPAPSPEAEEGPSSQRAAQGLSAPTVSAKGPALDPRRYGVLALTSGRGLLLFLAVLGFGAQFVDDLMTPERGEALVESGVDLVAMGGLALAALALVVSVVVVALLSVVEAMLRYGDFSVEVQGGDLVVTRGLLEKRVSTLPRSKVQAVRVVQPLGLWLLGYAAVDAHVTGHTEAKGAATRLHPALRLDEVGPFVRDLLPEFDAEGPAIRPPARALIRFFVSPNVLLIGLIVVQFVVFAALSVQGVDVPWQAQAVALGATGALLALRLGIAPTVFRDTSIEVAGSRLAVAGWGPTKGRMVVPRSRVQDAFLTSSWFQRRRGLVTAHIRVASGAGGHAFQAPNLDAREAEAVLDWLGKR